MNASGRHEGQDPVVKEYSRAAEAYDGKWSFYLEATTRETVARLNLRPTDRLLDVGCGTGVLLDRLSATFDAAQLVGVDPVPEMLAIARNRLSPSIELRDGWAERLPFPANQFDVVVSCNVFHFIREPVRALREMRRVLRPGGRLVITDWCNDYPTCRACDLYLRLFNRAHFKTYRAQECAQLLREAGYAVADIDCYKINWLWGLMTAKATRGATLTTPTDETWSRTMNAPAGPTGDSLRENKQEMSDAMRAYHQSEISHANHAITMLLGVSGAAGAAVLAMLFPDKPPEHVTQVAWGLWLTVTIFALAIAIATHRKISADHKVYEGFGEEYVKTSQLLGFYENVEVEGEATTIKTSTEVGKGRGYRRTQRVIWSFAGVLIILTFLFAVLSGRLEPKTQPDATADTPSALLGFDHSKNANARTSMLSRGGASGGLVGSVKAVWGVNRARPSVRES